MVKKEGKYTVNARVDVDYSKGKPKIKFNYPYKNLEKESVKQGGHAISLILIWFLIGLLPIIIYSFNFNNQYYPYPETCENINYDNLNYIREVKYHGNSLWDGYNFSYQAFYGFNLTCDNQIREFEYSTDSGKFIEQSNESKYVLIVLILTIWFYLSMLPSIYLNKLITKRLVKKKWYQKWLPKVQAEGLIFKTRNKDYSKFKPNDVLENVIIIPYFKNVELDYKTKGDFSKQLNKIKIREYRKNKINIKSKKVSKEKMDKFKWYAVFYFKEKPKNGYLEVIYQ